MKFIIKYNLVLLLILTACKQEKAKKQQQETTSQAIAYDSFGAKITADKVLTANEMLANFKTLKVGDTIAVKFTSTIKELCTNKGCWMKLPLDVDTETMVRFKDYGFFMPLDAKDREVIVAGKAFVKETSVKELQHYAEDAGKSKEEIAKITVPKKEFSFEAHGVLMKLP